MTKTTTRRSTRSGASRGTKKKQTARRGTRRRRPRQRRRRRVDGGKGKASAASQEEDRQRRLRQQREKEERIAQNQPGVRKQNWIGIWRVPGVDKDGKSVRVLPPSIDPKYDVKRSDDEMAAAHQLLPIAPPSSVSSVYSVSSPSPSPLPETSSPPSPPPTIWSQLHHDRFSPADILPPRKKDGVK